MHKEILTKEQVDLLSLVREFKKDFGLVGGTAIALQIGHRRSVDFDLFTLKDFDNARVRSLIKKCGTEIDKTYQDEVGQFSFLASRARFTFLLYPFKISFSKRFEDIARMPDLETLAAMKAYALGRRAKWKDYVDLYFIIRHFCSIKNIVEKCEKIFKGEFNEKKFREQLGYFDDIDYSEKVIFLLGCEVEDNKIKEELIKFSLEK